MTYCTSQKLVFAFISTLAVFFSSCASGNGKKGNTSTTDSPSATKTVAYDTTLAKGIVTDSVICINQNQQSYALYLPTYYSAAKKYPCMYFFDPHARGALPLNMYKGIAEKYGFVLVGSNTSKNGADGRANHSGIVTMMEDAHNRINIDPKRVFTAGFSGGSRWASTVAMQDGGIAGVIGCGAGFSMSQNSAGRFYFFGIVGDSDFNYTEMNEADRGLAQLNFSHQLLTFNGIHRWPSPADFEAAVQWMIVNEMKAGVVPKNDSLINSFKEKFEQRVLAATKAGDLIKVHQLLEGITTLLNGMADINIFTKQLSAVGSDDRYKQESTLQAALDKTEQDSQQELRKAFQNKDEKWWAEKIRELNRNASTAKTKQESLMYTRLVNYLGLVGYMYTSHALNANDLDNAAHYQHIFKMADPKNPDCGYLGAILFMKKGDKAQALASLKESASFGYSDVGQLVNDPVLGGLVNEAGFGDVLKKVKENYSGK